MKNEMTLDIPNDGAVKDYSLTGSYSELARQRGLTEAVWYQSPVPKQVMRELLVRKDGPAIRDCTVYFGLIALAGYLTFIGWGSAWAFLPMMIYGVLYASASDSRWHESSHGTAFKTDWMNDALYEVASFMVLRESIPWRWSHTRHHSDTIIVGRDPEIAVPRPPNLLLLVLKFFNALAFRRYVSNIALHCVGRVTADEVTYIPVAEYPKVFVRARIYAVILMCVVVSSIVYQTWLPLIFVFGPNLYGAWLMPIYALTQHAGLAEDVLDHRLNCRTIRMNWLNRFLYWNMNYHVEHHMFPLVPYHQLPKLNAAIQADCPPAYPSLSAAYREIFSALFRQRQDPTYFVQRALPTSTNPAETPVAGASVPVPARTAVNGWVAVCETGGLVRNDVIRFDHGKRTFAIYRTEQDTYHATDGMCTHGNTHLADGLVIGNLIECPKHNGRFDITDGSPQRAPVCASICTHGIKVEAGNIWLNIDDANAAPTEVQSSYRFRVVSNRNVATYIRELILEAEAGDGMPEYLAGQYMQLEIPAYDRIAYHDAEINAPFRQTWVDMGMLDYTASNPFNVRRNYSLASTPVTDGRQLRFNIRIAPPPRGKQCGAGVGSSYVLSLRPGDTVTALGPFGNFLIKDTRREMVYVGGGAGMAPLRSHLAHLFEALKTKRKVSFWYGARSRQEVFYADYFQVLAQHYPNFSFHVALSEPRSGDAWTGEVGFIHEVLQRQYLATHADPREIEFYLCGPQAMVTATQNLLVHELGVVAQDIAFDEF